MNRKLGVILAAGAALFLAACESEAPAPEAAAGPSSATSIDPSSLQYFQQTVGDRVFFETDSSRITGLSQQTLQRQAAWLSDNPGVNAVIEGHADERGTREYNLALGARRANAAKAFLASQGVDPARITTISYGKERPLATGSNESSWAKNRNATSVLLVAGS